MCPRPIPTPVHVRRLAPHPASKMMGTCFCFGLLVIGAVVALPAPEEGRELGYEPYDSPGYPDKWQQHSSIGECTGVTKPLLVGLLVGGLVKLPLLLLGKLLLLKATAPLAVGAALLPLGLYAVYRSSLQQPEQAKPSSRLLPEDCLLATACYLGAVAPKSALSSATWMMKMLEDGLEKQNSATIGVSSYREAYIKGASSKSCTSYACPYF